MTVLDEYAKRLQEIAGHFAKSATIATSRMYAAELLTDDVLPSRKLMLAQSQSWVDDVCAAQDIDPPRIVRMRAKRNMVGAACSEEHASLLHALYGLCDKPARWTTTHN